MQRILPIAACAILVLCGCEKEITVDLPNPPDQLVVEGTIEPGRPPFVILTRTQSYFAPTDANSLSNIFVGGAAITVDNGNGPIALEPFCSGTLTPEQIALAAQLTGLDPSLLSLANICVYSSTNTALFGVEGASYRLRVEAEDKVLTSVTTIPHVVALDSVWFKLAHAQVNDDSLGYAWGHITDPDTMGNYYRWYGRRISHRADGSEEDPTFISPLGSTFEDKYINGLSFDFNVIRGRQFYSSEPEDDNEEQGYFKVGDTIAVKFVSIGKPEYLFYTTYDNNVGSQGDLFSTPSNVKTNITGGLGIWAGWGTYADTIICQ